MSHQRLAFWVAIWGTGINQPVLRQSTDYSPLTSHNNIPIEKFPTYIESRRLIDKNGNHSYLLWHNTVTIIVECLELMKAVARPRVQIKDSQTLYEIKVLLPSKKLHCMVTCTITCTCSWGTVLLNSNLKQWPFSEKYKDNIHVHTCIYTCYMCIP
jgi:hypothetical protein